MVVLADVLKECLGLPVPCELEDVVWISSCCKERGATDAEGVTVDAIREISASQRLSNCVDKGCAGEWPSWAKIKGRIIWAGWLNSEHII